MQFEPPVSPSRSLSLTPSRPLFAPRRPAATLLALLLAGLSCGKPPTDQETGGSGGAGETGGGGGNDGTAGTGGKAGAAGTGGRAGSGGTGGRAGNGGPGGQAGSVATPDAAAPTPDAAVGGSGGAAGGAGGGAGGAGGRVESPVCQDMPSATPPALKRTQIVNIGGNAQPGQVVGVPGESILYVVGHKNGNVYIIQDGKLNPTPFTKVDIITNGNDEQGFLGMALHPAFATNQLFYLFYTAANGANIKVDEHKRLTPTTAMPTGNVIWDKPRVGGGAFHNGGSIYFNPKDGGKPLLYHAIGNTASRPESGRAEGTAGRLVVHDLEAKTSKTLAYGLRNPYRMSIDRLTGDIWMGDVSDSPGGSILFLSGASKEVKNFGYPNGDVGAGISGHDGGSGAIIGGVVYRGTKIKGLCGRYFYGLWRAGTVKSMIQVNGQRMGGSVTHPELNVPSLTSFGEDGEGEIYMSGQGGGVYKLEAAQ